ncbi:MAG: lytic murein transglycosylase [Bdellovibrionales bacterium]|nr:lytic murein transglycosylase [Bdellovibrionales bacterium]
MRFPFILFCLSFCFTLTASAELPPFDTNIAQKNISKQTPYRGWDHLVARLVTSGVAHHDVRKIYQNPQMPAYSSVSFSIVPKESKSLYSNFTRSSNIKLANSFLNSHQKIFDEVEKKYPVNRYVITSIMLVETQTGRFTGDSKVIYRLSRLAGIADPSNLVLNYHRLKARDKKVSYIEVKDRGDKLEEMFLPEISALIEIANRNKYNVFEIKGSSAGAFGLPQFLPSSYLKFGLDGNSDGVISLFDPNDAIWSVANFLSHFNWNNSLSYGDKSKVIYNYNRSKAYVDTVLEIERLLSTQSRS